MLVNASRRSAHLVTLVPTGSSIRYQWSDGHVQIVDPSEVSLVEAYKVDAGVVDLVVLEVTRASGSAGWVGEGTQAFDTLLQWLESRLHGFPNKQDWFSSVAFPPFESQRRTLWSD